MFNKQIVLGLRNLYLFNKYVVLGSTHIIEYSQVDTTPRTDLGFQVKGGRSISKKKKNYEISDKYVFSINKQSTKKNTQNFCFVIYYNTIIY